MGKPTWTICTTLVLDVRTISPKELAQVYLCRFHLNGSWRLHLHMVKVEFPRRPLDSSVSDDK